MWRVEKDPFLASTFGAVTILDRPPDFDRLRARMESAVHAVPRLGWRVQPNPTGLGAPIWADDPDFDIDLHVRRVALPAPGTLRQLLDLATPVRARPARSHPPAVAVPGRRGSGGRQGGADHEDAPHDHRRGQRSTHVDAVLRPLPRMPPNRPAERSSAHAGGAASPAHPGRQCAELRPRHVPAADQHRPPSGRAARRSDGDPGGRVGCRRRHPRRADPAVGLRRRPLTAVDRPVDAPPAGIGAGAVGFDQGGGQAPRGFDQRRLSHRRRRGRPPLSRRSRAARSTNCAPRWRSARAPRTPEPTPSGSSSFSYRPAR